MSQPNVENDIPELDDQSDDGQRGSVRSTIRFPYSGLADAEEIVVTMYQNRGSEADTDLVAADLNTTSQSGTFRTKLAAAGTFGLTKTVRGTGKIRLTSLGQRIADPDTRLAARVEAFLNVPLYYKIYQEFRGKRLPGDAGLESEMERFGVSRKQVGRARQAMVRSAETAGFYASGRDRLVEPAVRQQSKLKDENDFKGDGGVDEDGEQERMRQQPPTIVDHPLIQGLLQVLPAPGETLSSERRKKWMATLENSLELIYPEPRSSEPEQLSERSANATQGSPSQVEPAHSNHV
jgi:hypothetical protein